MEKITFLLNRTVKRIEFTISHWAEVAHFILRHIDNAFDRAAASIEYSVQLASKDIGYCALWLVNTLSVKFTGKDISSDKMSVGYENSVQLTELHYCSDSAKIECLYNTKAQHIENDSESMRCRYFKPVKLGELDSITIGNTTKKLKDWLYTEL